MFRRAANQVRRVSVACSGGVARDKLTVSKWSSERCREGLAVAMPVGIFICTCSGRLECM